MVKLFSVNFSTVAEIVTKWVFNFMLSIARGLLIVTFSTKSAFTSFKFNTAKSNEFIFFT